MSGRTTTGVTRQWALLVEDLQGYGDQVWLHTPDCTVISVRSSNRWIRPQGGIHVAALKPVSHSTSLTGEIVRLSCRRTSFKNTETLEKSIAPSGQRARIRIRSITIDDRPGARQAPLRFSRIKALANENASMLPLIALVLQA